MKALNLEPETARRFLRRALLLDEPVPDVGAALAHQGYVQIDPINVCGRMHDHILRNRVSGYREGGLQAYLHSPARPGFEHYFPQAGILVAFPIEAWPYLAPLIAGRRLRRSAVFRRGLGPRQEALARRILDEIAAAGPLTSDDIEHDGRAVTAWGAPGRLVKQLLEVMFVQGRVLISGRRSFRRVYDLPERVLPAAVRAAPDRTPEEIARWTILLRLRQRRLAVLKRAELPLVEDLVQPVRVEGCPPLYCLRADRALLEAGRGAPVREDVTLLAPLDPLIYDRRVTAALWGFDYTWEVYTPPAQRRRGYYALPVLAGTRLVGHVDPKANREAGRLRVVGRSVRRGYRVAPAVGELAGFLGLRRP